MSTDSTELTFIRCSSCRSLVPAMSTRCRMCGADLQPKKPSAEAESVKSKEPVKAAIPTIDVAEAMDPLNEFLSIEEPFDDVDIIDEQVVASPVEFPEENLGEELGLKQDNFEDDFDEEQAIRELDSLLEELNASAASKAVIEKIPTPIEEPRPVPVLEVAPKAIKQEVAEANKAAIAPVSKVSAVVEKPKIITKVKMKEENIMEKEIKVTENKISAIKSTPLKKSVEQSALIGWFVSNLESGGQSREIRAGKFFVTAQSLKPNDLIIEDSSVSTPHAMITVNQELGFQIQDLMSEHGLYLKKYGTKKYEVIDDIEVIENGDWIRFGNIEFMVVIMPG